MNFISDQIEELIHPKSIQDINSEEQYNEIKSVLQWDKYVSKEYNLTPDKSTLYNPAIGFYKEQSEWTKSGWKTVTNTDVNILSKYPEYVPSNEAINYLSSLDNILEIGAGSGYWSHVINKNNGNCIPTDLSPQERTKENISYPVTNMYDESENITIWSKVKKAKHTIIPEYPNHDILLCHPEGLEWTEEVLELMQPSQKLILVAGWYPSPNATPFFFKKLIDDWQLEKQIPIYRFNSSHASMYVFNKIH